jgi:hypothetical protein
VRTAAFGPSTMTTPNRFWAGCGAGILTGAPAGKHTSPLSLRLKEQRWPENTILRNTRDSSDCRCSASPHSFLLKLWLPALPEMAALFERALTPQDIFTRWSRRDDLICTTRLMSVFERVCSIRIQASLGLNRSRVVARFLVEGIIPGGCWSSPAWVASRPEPVEALRLSSRTGLSKIFVRIS